MKKQIVSIVLVVALAAIFTGCAANNNQPGATAPTVNPLPSATLYPTANGVPAVSSPPAMVNPTANASPIFPTGSPYVTAAR